MGTIYQAECSCGYVSAELLAGCGMLGKDTCRDLARCNHCKIIVTTPAASKRLRCPECRRKLEIIIFNEECSENPIILDCPQCGDRIMELREVGIWD
ncbi:MAG: hypothetical protein HN916_07755 [Anaerolineae bacterium]|jgi:primosomal protein N'|nr:hypothetical protein [Anaerolineae bacterium]